MFIICWLPIQTFDLLIYFDKSYLTITSNDNYNFFVIGYLISQWLSMAHTIINPIIYSFLSKNFRVSKKLNEQNLTKYLFLSLISS